MSSLNITKQVMKPITFEAPLKSGVVFKRTRSNPQTPNMEHETNGVQFPLSGATGLLPRLHVYNC